MLATHSSPASATSHEIPPLLAQMVTPRPSRNNGVTTTVTSPMNCAILPRPPIRSCTGRMSEANTSEAARMASVVGRGMRSDAIMQTAIATIMLRMT